MSKQIIVISHERSGTHFLINTIAVNFGRSSEVLNLGGNPLATALDISRSPETIRKSHHQAEFFGDRIHDVLRENHVFYVIRDCRGVMVSLFHYFNGERGDIFPQFERISQLIDAKPPDYTFDCGYTKVQALNFPQRWAIHIDSWQPHFNNLCVVTYEDLSMRLEETTYRIGAVIGKLPDGRPRRPQLRGMFSVSPYRGVLNGWQEEMSQRDSARIRRMVQRHERWLTSP